MQRLSLPRVDFSLDRLIQGKIAFSSEVVPVRVKKTRQSKNSPLFDAFSQSPMRYPLRWETPWLNALAIAVFTRVSAGSTDSGNTSAI